jgi:hypothetical protein
VGGGGTAWFVFESAVPALMKELTSRRLKCVRFEVLTPVIDEL